MAQNRICSLFGIRYPIIQAPMNWVSGAALTSAVSVPKRFMLARDLQNAFTEKFKQMQESGASSEQLNQYLEEHSPYQAQHLGEATHAEIHCGQGAGLIHDIPPAAKLIESIIADLKKSFAALEEQVRAFG